MTAHPKRIRTPAGRHRQGKGAGKYKGRKATAKAKMPDIKRLIAEGMRPNAIAKRLGISRASVYRLLAA